MDGAKRTCGCSFLSFFLFSNQVPLPLSFAHFYKRKEQPPTHTKKRHCASGTFLFRVFVGWQSKQRATFALLKREHNKANWQIPSIVAVLFFLFVCPTFLAKIERGGRKALDQFNKLFRCLLGLGRQFLFPSKFECASKAQATRNQNWSNRSNQASFSPPHCSNSNAPKRI